MANFNEQVNSKIGYILFTQNCFIYHMESMQLFERTIAKFLYYRKNLYRLFIQYNTTHPVESIAGNCLRWDCASATSDKVEVTRLDCDSNDDFGDPRFDHISGAIFITDKHVFTYGDTSFKAVDLEKEHVVCDAYLCGRLVSRLSAMRIYEVGWYRNSESQQKCSTIFLV